MFQTLINAFKNKEIRNKILITIAILFVYRLGCWLPVPGISSNVYNSELNSLFELLSAISGSALQNGAFLAIGISPYINASIIIQLLTVAIPPLERLTKQGDEGRKKIAQITRYLTVVLAAAQATGIVISWASEGLLDTAVFGPNTPEVLIGVFVGAILVAGSLLTMWIGERLTDLGIGNGISLLIFVGILSTAGLALKDQVMLIVNGGGNEYVWELIAFLALVIVLFALIVFIDLSERRIPVNYAKQVKGRKQYGGQATHIPIKVNANGVMPIIFATAIVTFPQMIFQLFSSGKTDGAAFKIFSWWSRYVGTDSVAYFVLTGLLILFFSYFYSQIQFNPDDVARNLQQYGGTIIGIRPGKPTAEYLGKINKRLTLFGAIFLAFLAIVPSVLFKLLLTNASLINAFTATGMLIIVSVALELQKQLEGQLMMKHYKGFLK